MNAIRRIFVVLLVGVLFAGCVPLVPGMPGSSDLDSAATTTAENLKGIVSGDFGATPNPVYYGTGCSAGESTLLTAYLNTSGKWTTDYTLPTGYGDPVALDIELVYEFLDVPTTMGIPGTAKFSETETTPGYRTATVDLSGETFNGGSGILMLSYHVAGMFLQPDGPFTVKSHTETLYSSSYVSIPIYPCGKSTPTASAVDYSGELSFSVPVVYKGDCRAGEPKEVTVTYKPRAVITDPGIEYFMVLQYANSAGVLFPEEQVKMTYADGVWTATFNPSASGYMSEDGSIVIKARIQTASAPAKVLYEWNNFMAGYSSMIELKMCKPPMSLTCSAEGFTTTALEAIGAPVYFPAPVPETSCEGGAFIQCSPPSGSIFPVGLTKVECKSLDSCGNTAACSLNVNVLPPLPTLTATTTPTKKPATLPTHTPTPQQIVPMDTPAFSCSSLPDSGSCGQYPNCQWVQNSTPPNYGVCKNIQP